MMLAQVGAVVGRVLGWFGVAFEGGFLWRLSGPLVVGGLAGCLLKRLSD